MRDDQLQMLRNEFAVGCRYWYQLRLWRECGSFESSSIEDRIRVAQQVLAEAGDGGVMWVWAGWREMVDHLIERLDDPVPEIRQEAAISLGDLENDGRVVVPVLLERLQSSEITPHDRACSAWALGQIRHDADTVVPALLEVLGQTLDHEEFNELRRYAADAVERLTNDPAVLLSVARSCLRDRFWKCRMTGLKLVSQLGEKGWELLPLVEPMLKDDLPEIRAWAGQIVTARR